MRKMFFTFLGALFALPPCFGAWREVSEYFFRENSQILVNANLKLNAELLSQSPAARNDWLLNSVTQYIDSFPASPNAFLAQRILTWEQSLELVKPLSWGGVVSVEQSFQRRDNSRVQVAFINNDIFWDASTTFRYTQDLGRNFFGQSFEQEVKMAKEQEDLSKLELTLQDEQLWLELFSFYVNTKIQYTQLALNKRSYSRSQERLKLIQRRVRDGLSLNIDLYQTQNNLILLEEAIRSTENTLGSSLQNLSQLLHRELNSNEIKSYSLQEGLINQTPRWPGEENIQENVLLARISLAEASLKFSNYQRNPSINLVGSYSTNAIQNDYSTAFEQGLPGSPNIVKSVALNISVPLGNEGADLVYAQRKNELRNAEIQLRKTRQNLEQTREQIWKRLGLLEENIRASLKRVELAKLILKERNKLYLQGRSELDQILLAEETLIETEFSVTRYMADYDLLSSQYAFASGKLSTYFGKFLE